MYYATTKSKTMKPTDKEFLELQKEWYDKLKLLGFDDLERSGGQLKDHYQPVRPASQEYYRCAGLFLHHFTNWPSDFHKAIWQLHAEGVSTREISTALKEPFPKETLSQKAISRIIQALRLEMASFDFGALDED